MSRLKGQRSIDRLCPTDFWHAYRLCGCGLGWCLSCLGKLILPKKEYTARYTSLKRLFWIRRSHNDKAQNINATETLKNPKICVYFAFACVFKAKANRSLWFKCALFFTSFWPLCFQPVAVWWPIKFLWNFTYVLATFSLANLFWLIEKDKTPAGLECRCWYRWYWPLPGIGNSTQYLWVLLLILQKVLNIPVRCYWSAKKKWPWSKKRILSRKFLPHQKQSTNH